MRYARGARLAFLIGHSANAVAAELATENKE